VQDRSDESQRLQPLRLANRQPIKGLIFPVKERHHWSIVLATASSFAPTLAFSHPPSLSERTTVALPAPRFIPASQLLPFLASHCVPTSFFPLGFFLGGLRAPFTPFFCNHVCLFSHRGFTGDVPLVQYCLLLSSPPFLHPSSRCKAYDCWLSPRVIPGGSASFVSEPKLLRSGRKGRFHRVTGPLEPSAGSGKLRTQH
jgi:hypothetical protein